MVPELEHPATMARAATPTAAAADRAFRFMSFLPGRNRWMRQVVVTANAHKLFCFAHETFLAELRMVNPCNVIVSIPTRLDTGNLMVFGRYRTNRPMTRIEKPSPRRNVRRQDILPPEDPLPAEIITARRIHVEGVAP